MRILMVCLGNICRSPLAEGIMRHLCQQQNLPWQIASAGTGAWHVGNPPDKRSIAAAQKRGYDISAQRAQQFNPSFFNQFDLILTMDAHNLHEILQQANNKNDQEKVALFLETDDVTDPYYNDNLFTPVCKQIEERCLQLINILKTV